MIARVYSAAAVGFTGKRIDVECDASNSLPGLLIVGLGNKAIDEARERVRSAIKNSGLEFPRKRVTVNLAPANLPKDGAHFDIAIAIALLVVSGQLTQEAVKDCLMVGELALDGTLRPVKGAIHYAETALSHKLSTLIVPTENAQQASLVKGVTVLPANSLRDVYLHFCNQSRLASFAAVPSKKALPKANPTAMQDVRGQQQAKRAMLIAAAGHHNILLNGPPGAGKTMLAKALTSILPPLSDPEIVEVTKLQSLTSEAYQNVVAERPFRSPHHTSSHVALIGGGQHPQPGEISLAHKGVLFLDELPEYSRLALESLRQPLEDRCIHIARANQRVVYPADFMLVATQNPCPCGYAGDQNNSCTCSAQHVLRYQKKISGPLLDRIDMIVNVHRISPTELLSSPDNDTLDYASLIATARATQATRYKRTDFTNANLTGKNIAQKVALQAQVQNLLDCAVTQLNLSARSYFKSIKVARTIADIDQSVSVTPAHIAEALQYRPINQD